MKKILSFLVALSICTVSLLNFSSMTVAAQEPSPSDDAKIIQTFIDGIEESENVTINENNLIDYTIEDEVITLVVANEVDGFTIYRSLSDEEQLTGQPDAETRGIIKTIFGWIMKIYRAGRYVCSVVQYGTGEDMCGMIGAALLNTMVPNVRYKATSYLYKNPNCVPAHSQQCNTYPNVYWKTQVVRA